MENTAGRQIIDSILEIDPRPVFEKHDLTSFGPFHSKAIGFLHAACNAFDKRFKDVMTEGFWLTPGSFRLKKMSEAHQLFARIEEFLHQQYKITPLEKYAISERSRIGLDLFKLLKIVAERPSVAPTWDELRLDDLYCGPEGTYLENFFGKYAGKGVYRARFWEQYMKKTVILSLDFSQERDTYLQDFIGEMEGIKFFFIYMRKIMVKQIKKISDRIHTEFPLCHN